MKFLHVQKVNSKSRTTAYAGLFNTMISDWWRCIFEMFIVGFELGLWTQRDDVHHLFKGKKVYEALPWQQRCCIFSSVFIEAFSNRSTCMDLCCLGWMREKKCLASASFCNWIPADSRLEQQRVPRGRQINRGTQPVCWRYLCRNQ